jgi:hypothetical protein
MKRLVLLELLLIEEETAKTLPLLKDVKADGILLLDLNDDDDDLLLLLAA